MDELAALFAGAGQRVLVSPGELDQQDYCSVEVGEDRARLVDDEQRDVCETPESCLKTSGALCGREPGDPLMGKSRSSRVLVRGNRGTGNRAARMRARPSSL